MAMANVPCDEQIVRDLDHAIDRLGEDIDRVELWSIAWRAWLEPVPDYRSAHEVRPPIDGADGGPRPS
jgi:hypothetical protein